MQIISSKDNELIKHLRKLKDKKYRDENNEYIVEGVKLIEEAVRENAKIKKIIIRKSPFIKNTSQKIIRFAPENRSEE